MIASETTHVDAVGVIRAEQQRERDQIVAHQTALRLDFRARVAAIGDVGSNRQLAATRRLRYRSTAAFARNRCRYTTVAPNRNESLHDAE